MINGKLIAFALLVVNIGLISSVPHNGEASIIETIRTHAASLPNPCLVCFAAIPLIKEFIIKNDTKSFRDLAVSFCVTFKLEEEDVCAGAIELFEPSVLAVIKNTALDDVEICSAFLNCAPIENPAWNWNITLPNVPKPPVKPIVPPTPSSPKLRVLHLTDLHIDFEYEPKSLADCDQPLCCRRSSMSKRGNITPDRLAGYWGDYRNCDLPLWTLQNMLQHISESEGFDIIYWTGDLPPHNVWDQTQNDQILALKSLTTLFRAYFPNKSIFPALGNHEAAPVNLYPPPSIKEDNITWLYEELAASWTQTGLPESLIPDIIRGAFYTIPITTGLRLISLNMNYCPTDNFWLFINTTDPLNQLSWLANMLQQAEAADEKVHIIGHVGPDDCMPSWKSNYFRIVNRYESTVAGQFFGHTHSDEFNIFYDIEDPKRAFSVAYKPGSATTYSNLNPGYRIYEIDGAYANSSYQVLNYRNVYLNLTEANSGLVPVWRDEYIAKDDFDMKGLYAQDWDDLINRMLADLNGPLVDKLLKFNAKLADVPINCDLNCRHSFVCSYKFYATSVPC